MKLPIQVRGGFTLIELLVVIAIIGILSSVVLASLNTARIKNSDVAVKAAMKQFLIEAQSYLDTNSTLGTSISTCSLGVFSSTKGGAIITNIQSNAGGSPTCSTDAGGSKWAVSIVLKSGGNFCADNSQGTFNVGILNSSAGICQ